MSSLATTLSVLIAVVVGVALIHLLSALQRRLRHETNAGSRLDAAILGIDVKYRELVWIAIPSVVGGMLLALWPAVNGGIAGAAGFFAAFLTVWPVYRFPDQLLADNLRAFWPKLKVLYCGFVGMSAALTYLGFVIVDRRLSDAGTLARAERWEQLLNRLSGIAVHGPGKYVLATLFGLGGLYLIRERVKIDNRAEGSQHDLVTDKASREPHERDA